MSSSYLRHTICWQHLIAMKYHARVAIIEAAEPFSICLIANVAAVFLSHPVATTMTRNVDQLIVQGGLC